MALSPTTSIAVVLVTDTQGIPSTFTVTAPGLPAGIPLPSSVTVFIPSPPGAEPNSGQPPPTAVPAPTSLRPSSSTRPSLSTGSTGSVPDPASSVSTLGSSPTPSSASISSQPSSSSLAPSLPSTSTSSSLPISPSSPTSPSTHSGLSHHVNIGAAIGGAFAGLIILATILVIFYLRKRNRSPNVHGAISQFDFESRPNGAENHSRSNDHKSDPFRRPSSPLEANDEQLEVAPTNGLGRIFPTLPVIPINTNPTAPPQSPDISRPQTTKEEARLIRRLRGHMSAGEIALIVDGWRAERERQNRDAADVTPETSGRVGRNVDRNARRSEGQDASGGVDFDSSMSVAQVTPPPSMNQDAPPPRYSRHIDNELP